MEQVTANLRKWLEATSFIERRSPTYIRLVKLADEIDLLAEDECAYARAQVENEYEDWMPPAQVEEARAEYFSQEFSDGYDAGVAAAEKRNARQSDAGRKTLLLRIARALGADSEWVDPDLCYFGCAHEFRCRGDGGEIRCPIFAEMRRLAGDE